MNGVLDILGEQRPFLDALGDARRRVTLPTSLSSSELEALDARIRANAFFSARVTNAEILDEFRGRLDGLIRGMSPGPGEYSDPAKIRLEMKQVLASLDYRPDDPRDEGTIKDLRSDARINLIVRTNEEFSKGYGQYLESTDPETIDLWPCWELVRVRESKAPRDWQARWEDAANQVGDDGAKAAFEQGRMVARKDSPIWAALSRFGVPHPPFDYNSGMGVEDVKRSVAIALGVIQRGDRITPPEHPANAAPAASVAGMAPDIRSTLLGSLGPQYTVDGDGVLHLADGEAAL